MQQEMKRIQYWGQIRNGKFLSEEQEYTMLNEFISEGDWVIDIGANVGHYTKKLSDLVGSEGRVIALEPMPETFALLSNNVRLFRNSNVTLFNIAASDKTDVVGMRVPRFKTGLKKFYRATITESGPEIRIMAGSIDSFSIPKSV